MDIDIISGYRVIRELGAGGMGQVFLVQHPRLPRRDALKLLDAGVSRNNDFKARFQREADLLAQLAHPNIVTLYDRGEFDGRLWITMEFIDGTDASALLDAADRIDTDLVIQLVAGAGAALDHAWRKQRITHRDVKPANILVGLDNGADGPVIESVKLADFGIAKAAGEATSLTSTGTTVGTMHYISPEAIEGEDVDNRSDIYSLGCTAFHLLTGRAPYAGKTIASLMSAHLTQTPPRISEIAPDLPSSLDPVFAKVLAKSPDDRYQSCADFITALHTHADDATSHPAFASTVSAATMSSRRASSSTTTGSGAGATGGTKAPKARMIAVAAATVAVVAAAALGASVLAQRSSQSDSADAAPVAVSTAPSSATPAPVETSRSRRTIAPTATTNNNLPELEAHAGVKQVTDESAYLKAVSMSPMYVRPRGRYTTEAEMLAFGYRACSKLDEHPTDAMAATRALYPGGNQIDGTITDHAKEIVSSSAKYLCPQHADLLPF